MKTVPGHPRRGETLAMRVRLWAVLGVLTAIGVAHAQPKGALSTEFPTDEAAVTWRNRTGQKVRITPPRLTIRDEGDASSVPLPVSPALHSLAHDRATLVYTVGSALGSAGTCRMTAQLQDAGDGLLVHVELAFERPVRSDVTLEWEVSLPYSRGAGVVLPARNGYVTTRPLGHGEFQAHFLLGRGSASGGTALALPAVGLSLKRPLAVAIDPYCGAAFHVSAGRWDAVRVAISTRYRGSVVPLQREERTIALRFHEDGVNGVLRTFDRTIPDIEPAPAWVHDIQLNYYDYISDLGEGWYRDVEALAQRLPAKHTGKVICCLHGYYDYVGHYGYDHETSTLAETWDSYDAKARAVPMSIEEVHRRIAFAKQRGFRVAYYFGDGPASDNSSPYYREDWVIRDPEGPLPTHGFWQWRPDTKDKKPVNHILDPGNPEVRAWHLGYMNALLAEYGHELDAFVWDETFLIPQGQVSIAGPRPTYSDREMMQLVGNLSKLVQKAHGKNPDLVFLTSDIGRVPYALAAHGTYQDSACQPEIWPPSMLPAWRNGLWSCNWYPVSGARNNRFAVEEYGLAQGVSNGWGDDCGPHEMPAEILSALIARFVQRAESGSDRTRLLTREPVVVPSEEEGNIAHLATVTASSEYDFEASANFRATGAVDGVVDGYPNDMGAEWASANETVGAWLRLTWDAPQTIDRVLLFDRPHPNADITSGTLTFSDGSSIATGPLPGTAATPLETVFAPKTVRWLEFRVMGVASGSIYIGLSEIVVLRTQ